MIKKQTKTNEQMDLDRILERLGDLSKRQMNSTMPITRDEAKALLNFIQSMG